MIRLRHKLLIYMLRVFDQLVLVVTAAVIACVHTDTLVDSGDYALNTTFHLRDTVCMLIIATGWIILFDWIIRYKSDRLVALKTQMENITKATGLASIWLMISCALFSAWSLNIYNILIFFGLVTLVGIVSRLCLHVLLLSARRSGYNFRYLLVVGASERAHQVSTKIEEKPELGYKIVGFVAETSAAREAWELHDPGNWRVLGLLSDMRQILADERVDEIMVCLPLETRFSDIARIVQNARDLGIVVRLMFGIENGSLLSNLLVERLDDEHVVTLFREQMLIQLLTKRLVDTVFSTIALVILGPLMVVVGVLIKVTSPGPVLFVQNRVGMNQRQFRLYKFRSMVVDAEQRKCAIAHMNEQDGPVFKIANDPRMTRIGRFLRKTSIDELPQLFNVLCGEMSLVGPRPPLPEEVRDYAWLYRKRLSVKPGVTCIWQISGRNLVSFENWMKMDHEYIDNWSLWLDLKILLMTIPVVLLFRGAS